MGNELLAKELRAALLGMSDEQAASFVARLRVELDSATAQRQRNNLADLDMETLTRKLDDLNKSNTTGKESRHFAKEIERRLQAKPAARGVSAEGKRAMDDFRFKRIQVQTELSELQKQPSKNSQAIRAKTAELQGLMNEPDWSSVYPGDGESDG